MGLRNGWLYCYTYLHLKNIFTLQGDKSIMNTLFPRRAMYVERNIEERSRNHCCSGKEINVTYSEFVPVAVVIQHAIRMRRIILSPVACLYGCRVFHIATENKMCFDFLHTFV